jgi:ATPase family AAA domain-containing protein 3A/B
MTCLRVVPVRSLLALLLAVLAACGAAADAIGADVPMFPTSTLYPSTAKLRAGAESPGVLYRDAILDARPANLSDSLELVSRVALRSFTFAFDAAPAKAASRHRPGPRAQLGPLAHELLAAMGPAAEPLVRAVPERLVFDPADRARGPVALREELVVDASALFMHNVGATQALIRSSQQLARDVEALQKRLDAHEAQLERLEVYLAQEASAQLVEKRKIAEAEAQAATARVDESRERGEQERLSLNASLVNELELEHRRHELAQARLEQEDEARKAQNRDLVALQEAANVRMEQARRETETLLRDKQLALDRERALLERNTTLEKAAMDVDGRIRQQRANQDIEMAQLQQRLEAERVKLLQAMQATFDNLGRGAAALLAEDKRKLVQLVGGLVALAAGVFLSREAVRVAGALVQQRLGKPSLVRETSRVSGVVGLGRSRVEPVLWVVKALTRQTSTPAGEKAEALLADVVLLSALETRVREIARSTRNAALHGAPYRHLLLYGPPGTGKTMVAKRLASGSGMDYAILSGGDVGPLGADAVTELHALFAWANASPRGVLIFIDEAEAFLGCRASRKTHMSEHMRNALNALLYHTGSPSQSFMLVVATNRPEDLDAAVTDRIDDTLHFDLPEAHERVRLLEMYFDEYVGSLAGTSDSTSTVSDATKKGRSFVADVTARVLGSSDSGDEVRPTDVTRLASPVKASGLDAKKTMAAYGELTTGMSGREIAKMMLYLQSVVYAQDELHVSPALVDRVVREKVDEHRRKIELKRGEGMSMSMSSGGGAIGEGVFL